MMVSMEERKTPTIKKPIFVVAPPGRKIAVGELNVPASPGEARVIIVRKKDKAQIIKGSTHSDEFLNLPLINIITELFRRDYPEEALILISYCFEKLSHVEKVALTGNILEATKEYDIPANMLPESYYDFL